MVFNLLLYIDAILVSFQTIVSLIVLLYLLLRIVLSLLFQKTSKGVVEPTQRLFSFRLFLRISLSRPQQPVDEGSEGGPLVDGAGAVASGAGALAEKINCEVAVAALHQRLVQVLDYLLAGEPLSTRGLNPASLGGQPVAVRKQPQASRRNPLHRF